MGIHKSHFVSVPFGHTGDEVLHMAQSGPNRRRGFPRPEPRLDLQRPLPCGLVLQKLEIEVEVLEIAGELSAWALHLYHLRVHLYLHPIGDLHCI